MTELYAVRTTRIFCRVGCASRAPLPQNVVPVESVAAAIAAGFRPCKRCRPDGEHPQDTFRSATVAAAVPLLQRGEPVTAVADSLHVSERHLRRLIRQETGRSPREWVLA